MLVLQDKFKHVNIKAKKLKINDENESVTLVQIIDISSKVLLKEVEEREIFQKMVNATVSHELRNPLNVINA